NQNASSELKTLREKLNAVAETANAAYDMALTNDRRLANVEANQREFSVAFYHFPMYDNEDNYVKPSLHLAQMLNDAFGMDSKETDNVMDNISKSYYIGRPDDKADANFIVRFTKQEAKDAVIKNAFKLKDYKPAGKPVSIDHDMTEKQRKEKGKLVAAIKQMKKSGQDAKLYWAGSRTGYLLNYDHTKYAADTDFVKSVLKNADDPRKRKNGQN
ncbi:hypothetical protein AAVH_42643, partial [Aphelenchoides avenae]